MISLGYLCILACSFLNWKTVSIHLSVRSLLVTEGSRYTSDNWWARCSLMQPPVQYRMFHPIYLNIEWLNVAFWQPLLKHQNVRTVSHIVRTVSQLVFSLYWLMALPNQVPLWIALIGYFVPPSLRFRPDWFLCVSVHISALHFP